MDVELLVVGGCPHEASAAALLRAALGTPGPVRVSTSARTGLRVASLRRMVTSEDVRSLDDDE